MRLGIRIIQLYQHLPLRRRLSCSAASVKGFSQLNGDCDEFLPWLRGKAGHEISSTLSVGVSSYGRSLFASKSIQAGDCILKVPYSVHISPENLLPEIQYLFVHDVSDVSKLALVLLVEQKLGQVECQLLGLYCRHGKAKPSLVVAYVAVIGLLKQIVQSIYFSLSQNSEWAPYIGSLPHVSEMHNTIFWSEDELQMVRRSRLWQETIDKKAYIQKEFSAIKRALGHAHQLLGDCKLENFMHAHALDFLNHNGISEAVLLSDDDKEISEVIADRDYAAGEQVLIRYGKFSDATLLLDFGFTILDNIHNQVQIWIDIPLHDPLYSMKLELWHKHRLPTLRDSSGNFFTIKEVSSSSEKGKGIPQSLRALARVLVATSKEELNAMEIEAAENDNRLARRPLRNRDKEILSHRLLLSRFDNIIQEYDAAIKVVKSSKASDHCSRFAHRRQMAINVLDGEVRVLRSASFWLRNYCQELLW